MKFEIIMTATFCLQKINAVLHLVQMKLLIYSKQEVMPLPFSLPTANLRTLHQRFVFSKNKIASYSYRIMQINIKVI